MLYIIVPYENGFNVQHPHYEPIEPITTEAVTYKTVWVVDTYTHTLKAAVAEQTRLVKQNQRRNVETLANLKLLDRRYKYGTF